MNVVLSRNESESHRIRIDTEIDIQGEVVGRSTVRKDKPRATY